MARLARPVASVVVAEVLSSASGQLGYIALLWFVLATGGSAVKLSLVLVALVLPGALLGVPSGEWSRRVGPIKTLLICNVIGGTFILMIPTLYLSGALPFWLLMLILAVNETVFAPYWTSEEIVMAGALRDDVEESARALALLQGGNRAASIAGPLVGGVLVGILGAPIVLGVEGVMFFVVFAVLWFGLKEERREASVRTATAKGTEGRETGRVPEALMFLLRDRVLGPWSIAAFISEASYKALFLVVPVVAFEKLHSATDAGALFTAFGAGAVAGTILCYRLLKPGRAVLLARVGKVGQALGFGLLVAAGSFWALLGIVVFVGLWNGIANPATAAIAVVKPPVGLRAIVGTTRMSVSILGGVVGTLAIGQMLTRHMGPAGFWSMAVAQVIALAVFMIGSGRVGKAQGSDGPAEPLAC